MTEEQIALAKRAVACKGWRWMPGMRTDSKFARVVAVDSDTGSPCVAEEGASQDHCYTAWLDDGHSLPDLTDPATLGCLLALVREAWGDPRAYVRAGFGWEWITDYCVEKWPPGGETEAEALVSALECAP